MKLNFWRFFLDFLALLVVIAPSIFLRIMGERITFKRGFFCDDPDLKYPKKEESYTGKIIWIIATIVPLFTIIFYEMFIYHKRKQLSSKKLIKIFVIDIYKKILAYTFGLVSVNLVCNVFKYSIGRLRPHFFQYCKPIDQITGVLLSNCSNLENRYEYIENYVCSNDVVNNVRLSFFSGHATILSYQFIYFLLYTQNNMKLNIFGLIRPLIQIFNLIVSIYFALSRAFDYYHHPSDLVFGSVVGTAGAIITYHFLSEYAESYWLKSTQFLYSHKYDNEVNDLKEQIDVEDAKSEFRKKLPVRKENAVRKNKLQKTSKIVQNDERTALISNNKSH